MGFSGRKVSHSLYLQDVSTLSEHGIAASRLGLVLPGQPYPRQLQAIHLPLDQLEAKTISAPGKSVTISLFYGRICKYAAIHPT